MTYSIEFPVNTKPIEFYSIEQLNLEREREKHAKKASSKNDRCGIRQNPIPSFNSSMSFFSGNTNKMPIRSIVKKKNTPNLK